MRPGDGLADNRIEKIRYNCELRYDCCFLCVLIFGEHEEMRPTDGLQDAPPDFICLKIPSNDV